MCRISVIIPSYNSAATIAACLDSLLAQTGPPADEIIVVDSSCDDTPDIVSRYPHVTLIHLDAKTDPGTARNLGIHTAVGDILAFIDSDCVAAPDWLEKIASAHAAGYAVAGGCIHSANHSSDVVGQAGYLAEFRDFIPGLPRRECRHVPTCNISYGRSIFEHHGLFQGAYYPQEDLVFNYRLWTRGVKILFDPEIKVFHRHRSAAADFFGHQYRIGCVTAQVLAVINLQGSFLARHRVLGVCAVPLLPVVKYINTVRVFRKHQSRALRACPLALLAAGLLCWAAGFVRGLFHDGKGGAMHTVVRT